MTKPLNTNNDVTVIGAGFSGSLTALCLNRMGYNVVLIEKNKHPRFAIGESSTPIADMILRDLSDRYDLPWLKSISRYGSWQKNYPEVSCGLKRGFSYYQQQKGQSFRTDNSHSGELLVAASVDDNHSDTNWYRRDVDTFFVKHVKEAGIAYYDQTVVGSIKRSGSQWEIESLRKGAELTFRSNWLIDASGSGAIADLSGIQVTADGFLTNSSALFSHFTGVKPWRDWLLEHGISDEDYPYNPDHSALHHLLDEGWLWMLRFNNGITSAGLVFDRRRMSEKSGSPGEVWHRTIGQYPGLADMFKEAEPADDPGGFIRTGRLQRRTAKACGEGWVALPHTAGFVDPLHSTGIAHSLSGVERILQIFETGGNDHTGINKRFRDYEKAVFSELSFIDLLVAGCYEAMPHFQLFHSYTMLYFIAAITYEQKRLHGTFNMEKQQFLSAGHKEIPGIAENLYRDLKQITRNGKITGEETGAFRESVRKAIEPYNTAGLLRPPVPNMYEHTAADF